MKRLLIALALAASIVPAKATDIEKAYAIVLMYDTNCGDGVPEKYLRIAREYAWANPVEISAKMKEVQVDIRGAPVAEWCAYLKPSIEGRVK
jgi:hypothetical protein